LKLPQGLNALDLIDSNNEKGSELILDCVEYLLMDVSNNFNEIDYVASKLTFIKAVYESDKVNKPQLTFSDKIDNNSMTPFVPRVVRKYHAVSPLSLIYYSAEEVDGKAKVAYYNPYMPEIHNWKPSMAQVSMSSPLPPPLLQMGSIVWINTIGKAVFLSSLPCLPQ
jgi:hypothetical protein